MKRCAAVALSPKDDLTDQRPSVSMLPDLHDPGLDKAQVLPMDCTQVMDPDALFCTAEMEAQFDPGLAEALVSPRVITQVLDPNAFCCTAEMDTQVASPCIPPDGAAHCGLAAPAARVVPELCIQGCFFQMSC